MTRTDYQAPAARVFNIKTADVLCVSGGNASLEELPENDFGEF